MATKQIKDLTATTVIASGDQIAIDQVSGISKKILYSDFSMSPLDRVRFYGFAGYGSTETNRPYFTNVAGDISGADPAWSYVNDSTDGLKISILKDGRYAEIFGFNSPSAAAYEMALGQNLNGTISPITQTPNNIAALIAREAGSGIIRDTVASVRRYNAGQTVGPITDAGTPGNVGRTFYYITMVSE